MQLKPTEGVTLRQAAVIAGLGYLLDPVAYAEFGLYPKFVIAGNIAQTVQNITSHRELFAVLILCYVINFIEDIVIAWALFVLLAPVNRAVSMLAAWFRIIYAAIALIGTFKLMTAYRLLTTSEYAQLFGRVQLNAQAVLAIHEFRYIYSAGLVIFGIHLALIGALIVRSRYIPWIIGALLFLDGLAWIATELQPYLYPGINVDLLFALFFAELIFMLWLLLFGWRIRDPAPNLA